MSKVIAIGPMKGVVTGQNVAFVESVNSFSVFKVIDLGGEGTSFFRKCLLAFLGWCLLLVEVFKTKRKCVIYITPSRSTLGFIRELPFYIIAVVFSIAYVNHIHGADLGAFYKRSNRVVQGFLKFIYSRAHTNIILLNSMVKQLDFIDSPKFSVVPNFVDVRCALPREKNHGKLRVLFMSNLIASKGVFTFIDAFRLLPVTAFHGVVAGAPVGDASNKAKVYSDVERACDEVECEFLGGVYGESKWDQLSKADVFVLPSYYPVEAFPLVILEAAAAGCFIVVTNHNYLPEIVKDFEHVVIPPKDHFSLAKVLEDLSQDKELLELAAKRNPIAALNYSQEKYRHRIRDLMGVKTLQN